MMTLDGNLKAHQKFNPNWEMNKGELGHTSWQFIDTAA